MTELSYTGGAVRAPLAQPDKEAQEEIARLLKESGLYDKEFVGASEQKVGAGIR
jgi:hypothetical protein